MTKKIKIKNGLPDYVTGFEIKVVKAGAPAL
jgi:hypothetical protein